MADTHTVQSDGSLLDLSKQHNVSFQEMKQQNPALATRDPQYSVKAGDVVNVPRSQERGDVRATCEQCPDCIKYTLKDPFLIALAKDPNIKPETSFPEPEDGALALGQDATHAGGRAAPGGQSVGTTVAELKPKMEGLLGVFARSDSDGKARRLFNAFLTPNSSVELFTDAGLDKAAEVHPNFITFSNRTLGAPTTGGPLAGKTRIHQALKAAGWDINKVQLIDDLLPFAFNRGDKVFNTEDFGNGLGVMINGVQYVFVRVTAYSYDSCKQQYVITLKFSIYDVFGLDDDDLREYGSSGGLFSSAAGVGITAWWQLQHQHNYAPLVTKAVVHRTFTVPTLGE